MATASSRTNGLKANGSARSARSHKRVRDFFDGLTASEIHFAGYEALRRLVETQPDEPFSICHPNDPSDFVGVVTPPGAVARSFLTSTDHGGAAFTIDPNDDRPAADQILEQLEAEFG